MSNDIVKNDGAVQARYDVPGAMMLPGMSKEVRPEVALLVHDDCHVANVARFADAPYRCCGTVKLLTLEDFKRFVSSRVSGASAPMIFVYRQAVRAVFNMDGWQDDVAVFPIEYTPEWLAWTGKDERTMKQDEFCDFLEDHLKEIVQPCGSELLEMVANFRQMTRVEYGSSYRGADGQIVLEYKEDKQGAGGRDMALPSEFVLHIPVIRGAEKMTIYEVHARLRVRVDKDTHKLTLQYILVRPDVPQDNAISDMVAHLRGAMPGIEVFAGLVDETPDRILCRG